MYGKSVLIAAALLAVLFSLGCGIGSGNSSGPKPVGNFSNSNLSGQYTFQITGFDATSDFREAGVFTADGNGHITAGVDDLSRGTTATSTSLTGSYSISNDGTGALTLNVNNGRTLSLVITLATSSEGYLIVNTTNVTATGFGTFEQQTPSAFNATPTGTFVYQLHDVNNQQPLAAVGAFTVSGGALTGTEDLLQLGSSATSGAITGNFNAPDSTSGRGTGILVDSLGTFSFNYYIVNANSIRLFSITSGEMGLGRAEAQTGGPFSNASLSGSFAFGTVGDTNNAFRGVNTAGAITSNGTGTISAGAFDSVQDGNASANVQATGTYSVASDGRATITLNNSIQYIAWLVGPSRAFLMVDDPSKVEDGTADMQQGTFSNSTMNGQFALVMDGFNVNTNDSFDRVGTLGWNNLGMLNLNEAVNFNGTINTPGFLSGQYSVASNGRVTGSVNSLSNNLVFYLISANDAYVIQADPGLVISGTISKQP